MLDVTKNTDVELLSALREKLSQHLKVDQRHFRFQLDLAFETIGSLKTLWMQTTHPEAALALLQPTLTVDKIRYLKTIKAEHQIVVDEESDRVPDNRDSELRIPTGFVGRHILTHEYAYVYEYHFSIEEVQAFLDI